MDLHGEGVRLVHHEVHKAGTPTGSTTVGLPVGAHMLAPKHALSPGCTLLLHPAHLARLVPVLSLPHCVPGLAPPSPQRPLQGWAVPQAGRSEELKC